MNTENAEEKIKEENMAKTNKSKSTEGVVQVEANLLSISF